MVSGGPKLTVAAAASGNQESQMVHAHLADIRQPHNACLQRHARRAAAAQHKGASSQAGTGPIQLERCLARVQAEDPVVFSLHRCASGSREPPGQRRKVRQDATCSALIVVAMRFFKMCF